MNKRNKYRVYFEKETISKGRELQEFYDIHSLYRMMSDIGSICKWEKMYLEKRDGDKLDTDEFARLIRFRSHMLLDDFYRGTVRTNRQYHG
jgi:hypothetical protein